MNYNGFGSLQSESAKTGQESLFFSRTCERVVHIGYGEKVLAKIREEAARQGFQVTEIKGDWLEDLVKEQVLERPTRHGRGRGSWEEWPDETVARVIEVLHLRQFGIRRQGQRRLFFAFKKPLDNPYRVR